MPVGPSYVDASRPHDAVSSGSDELADDRDRAGVRRVGEQGAEDDDELRVGLVDDLEQLLAEAPPAHVRLDAADQQHVPVGVLGPGQVEPRGRPRQPSYAVLVETDLRPVHLEVVVVLGVDRGDELRVPLVDEVVDRSGGRLGRVVPALERGDHDRVPQVREVNHSQAPCRLCSHPAGSPETGLPAYVLGRSGVPGFTPSGTCRTAPACPDLGRHGKLGAT